MPLYAEATATMAADPGSSGVLVAVMPGTPEVGMIKAQAILPALAASDKPKAYVVLGDARSIRRSPPHCRRRASPEALLQAGATPEGRDAARRLAEDEERFIDVSRSPAIFVTEHEILPAHAHP